MKVFRAVLFLAGLVAAPAVSAAQKTDRKSTRLNSSHSQISYAVFCLKKKKKINTSRISDLNKLTCIQLYSYKVLVISNRKQHSHHHNIQWTRLQQIAQYSICDTRDSI